MADPVAQYLATYAQPEAHAALALEDDWQAALVVPAYRETIDLLTGLREAAQRRRALVVVVVNRCQADRDAMAPNESLLNALRDLGDNRTLADGVFRVSSPPIELAVVDRSSEGRAMDDGDGVGLARRIGLDLCLAAWAGNKLSSRWLHTTDADAALPARYFAVADSASENVKCLTYPYRHLFAGESAHAARALALYEVSLRYYLLGLRSAGSPFAFSAIGSTMAIDANAYAIARGMPRRQAGEDFYMLAKLAKLGLIERPRVAPIELRGVRAVRTPFGTAAAVAKQLNKSSSEPFALYHPDSFAHLRVWQTSLESAISSGIADDLAELLSRPPFDSCLAPLVGLAKLRSALAQPRAKQRRDRIDGLWDALKTLRFIHALERGPLPKAPWLDALRRAPFVPDEELGDDPFSWRNRLEEAENTGSAVSGRASL